MQFFRWKMEVDMAYSGFLLKIGNYEFPQEYIKPETFSAYVNMQDLDPWTDANGYVHREPVDLKAFKVEFETVAMLTNKEVAKIMANIRANYTVPKGRQALITAYIQEYDDYVSQTGYMADFTPTIKGIYDGVIHYNPIRLAFIGGVYGG